MFEGGQQAYIGTLQVQNVRANADLTAWMNSARQWEAHARVLEQRLADAQAENERLKLALLVKTAHGEGMKAWKDAFKNAHSNSPIQADSGKRFKDKDIKTVGRLAYEAAHDRILRDAQIFNPAEYRVD